MKKSFILLLIVGLTTLSLSGCREEIQSENCEGKDKVVENKYYDQSIDRWTLVLDCGPAPAERMYIVWDANDGDPTRGVGPAEYERAKVGQPYGG